MDKGFFATDFYIYANQDFVKIDFFEQEPTTNEKNEIVLIKGVSQRITLPKETAKALIGDLTEILKK